MGRKQPYEAPVRAQLVISDIRKTLVCRPAEADTLNDCLGWEADAPKSGHPCYRPPMREGETKIEMVRRHIEVGAQHIAKQRALIVRLRQQDLPTDEAAALLILLEDIQRQHQEHLARFAKGLP